jgi:hypothetical protein
MQAATIFRLAQPYKGFRLLIQCNLIMQFWVTDTKVVRDICNNGRASDPTYGNRCGGHADRLSLGLIRCIEGTDLRMTCVGILAWDRRVHHQPNLFIVATDQRKYVRYDRPRIPSVSRTARNTTLGPPQRSPRGGEQGVHRMSRDEVPSIYAI